MDSQHEHTQNGPGPGVEDDPRRLETIRELMRAWTGLLDSEAALFRVDRGEVMARLVPNLLMLLTVQADWWASDPAYTDEAAWTELLRGWAEDGTY